MREAPRSTRMGDGMRERLTFTRRESPAEQTKGE